MRLGNIKPTFFLHCLCGTALFWHWDQPGRTVARKIQGSSLDWITVGPLWSPFSEYLDLQSNVLEKLQNINCMERLDNEIRGIFFLVSASWVPRKWVQNKWVVVVPGIPFLVFMLRLPIRLEQIDFGHILLLLHGLPVAVYDYLLWLLLQIIFTCVAALLPIM